ncbi:MAG: putative rane-bound mannosyltransferase [Chthoniobacteraceae bacterium]|nr:putative rane-bound mannosyltransferase [Chthoniobacteraceae bacterium]
MIPRRKWEPWIWGVIITTALVWRVVWLDGKPPHFDEGVNGAFVDGMTRQGFYSYDPGNFHGPLHFYILFVAQTLLGRHNWVLRLPVALISTGCVAMLFLFRPYFGRRACQIAALSMALSPAMVFYGRYAIHESSLLLFLMWAVLGILGLWRSGQKRFLWATALGITGTILTKETYVIHVVAALLTLPALLLLELVSKSAPLPFTRPQWNRFDFTTIAWVCAALILFFYTGGFLDWPSLPGLWETYRLWFATGNGAAPWHEKPWYYWIELLARYEWPALVGLAASLFVIAPGRSRPGRALAICGLGTLAAYSLIPYKTPWCLIVLIWPFHLFFGIGIDQAIRSLDKWVVSVGAAGALAYSLGICYLLNFREYTNAEEPYVYVQTLPDVNKLIKPLDFLTSRDPRNFQLPGLIITPEFHPFPWMLGDFTHVTFLTPSEELPRNLSDAEFLLVDTTLVGEVEARLNEPYFKEPLTVRGSSNDEAVLYLRAKTFTLCFPQRAPEFIPGAPIEQLFPDPVTPGPSLPSEDL